MPPLGRRAWRPQAVLLLLLASAASATLSRQQSQQQEPIEQDSKPLFSDVPPPHQRCGNVPVEGLELSPAEHELLQYICWPEDGPAPHAEALAVAAAARRGVPAGVNCTVEQWCDGDVCTDVCQRGSVSVEPWLAHAIRQQTRLVQTLPLCYATLLGTHNSAISLADGYGNLDEYFRGFFKYIKWALPDFASAPLHTNNQLLSLTDQLRLGVRSLELDTHWVNGVMRIAHCGGLHVPQLNKLIDAINFVARLLHKHIRWDTETLGCVPSLSSIPTMEQRTLTDALQEVKDWMDAPSNAHEFLVLYFDDQLNLKTWNVVPRLLDDILSVMPRSWIYTTEDREADGDKGWPSQQQLLSRGKRLLLVSGTDYGTDMQPLVFARGQTLCGWNEPPLASVDGTPECLVNAVGAIEPRPLFDGLLTRVISCELQYGPMNCDFVYRATNRPLFDEITLPPVMGCGLNMPSPDSLTPERAAAAIWTWAPGHPFDTTYEFWQYRAQQQQQEQQSQQQLPELGVNNAASSGASGGSSSSSSTTSSRSMAAAEWLQAASRAAAAAGDGEAQGAAAEANCGVLSASDARWRATLCTLPSLPSACRLFNATLGAPDGGWVVNASLPRGSCPEGTAFDLPRHPRENYLLAAALQQAGHEAAWLPVHGPDWSTDGWPAERQQRQPTDRHRILVHAVLPAAGGLAALAAAAAAVVGVRTLVLRRRSPQLYQALDQAEAEP